MDTNVVNRVRTLDVEIIGMTCGSCAARVQKTLSKQPGVSDAEVNFATGRARVDVDELADVATLQSAVERAGYTFILAEPAAPVTAAVDNSDTTPPVPEAADASPDPAPSTLAEATDVTDPAPPKPAETTSKPSS